MTGAAAIRAIPSKRNLSIALAVVTAAGAIGLFVEEARFRHVEAAVSAGALRLFHIGSAHSVGSSVVFPDDSHWIGYTVTASCTAALLISPFLIIGAALLLSGRLSVRGGLLALAAAVVIVALANQLRLLLIGASMRLWGFRTGYSRSHVLAGGVVSTLGVAVGIAAFVALILHEKSRTPRHPA